LYGYCKETIELPFQRIVEAARLKGLRVKMAHLSWRASCPIRFVTQRIIAKINQYPTSKIIWITLDGASEMIDYAQL